MDHAQLRVGFVLVPTKRLPDPQSVIKAAADLEEPRLSFHGSAGDDMLSFSHPLGSLIVSLMPVPHPDAAKLPFGPFSPSPDELAESPAHLIVVLQGGSGTLRERDRAMAALTGAVALASKGIAVMLGHGVCFHRLQSFISALVECDAEELPIPGCIDVTLAAEKDGLASLLTHGMTRYGREDIYVRASIDEHAIEDAYNLASSIASGMLASDTVYEDGDTVGRSAAERVVVRRIASPLGNATRVIFLDLSGDADEAPAAFGGRRDH